MTESFLIEGELPFCKGCGHFSVSQNTDKALQAAGFTPLDVVLVTDIGCHGIIDKYFRCHTVHGLHGRSVALGAGVASQLSPGKKVVVFIGDGGVSIGIGHLLMAAAKNLPMTVVVHNNFLYGMTGGQPSSLSPEGFKTPIQPEGKQEQAIDIRGLLHEAGAPLATRVLGRGDYSAELAEAFKEPGFSLVEVMELCPSYGVKYNPGVKLDDLVAKAGLGLGKLTRADRPFAETAPALPSSSLFEGLKKVSKGESAALADRFSLMISGSAGEGVQTAADVFVRAAMNCGLEVSKKGSYPVTVGVGFSACEIILSPRPFHFHGSAAPDAVLITSKDGLQYARAQMERMTRGDVMIDESLELPPVKVAAERRRFRAILGEKYGAIAALFHLLKTKKIFPAEAFVGELKAAGSKINFEKLAGI